MEQFDLDTPILSFSASKDNRPWTLRHAVEGVQIFGGIGSGKTSGSGRMITLKYLAAGFGGLVMTVKPNEKEEWEEYCRLTNRTKDLVVIEPSGKESFNFLEYISTQADGESAITENIADVMKTVIRANDVKDSGKGDNAFWDTALDLLIFNVIDLCKLAYGHVSIEMMYNIVQTIPRGKDTLLKQSEDDQKKAFPLALTTAYRKIKKRVDEWESGLSEKQHQFFINNPQAYDAAMYKAVPESRVMRYVDQFFTDNLIALNDKTRSIIDFTFSGFLFRLLREPIYSLFCQTSSTVVPEDCFNAKIILLNLPVKKFHKVGRDCQILFKYIWQRSMEKRDVRKNGRPVFLFADESQNFLHEHDASYQATARSSRIATVYISQNLPNYLGVMGGDKSQHLVKGFLGTLATKIFHANADVDTNEYASQLIGKTFFVNESESTSMTREFSKTQSRSLTLDFAVRPEQFNSLKTGGLHNNLKVEAYMHRQGDALINDLSYMRVSFAQNYQPK
jgi:hypothetical protein